MKNKLPFLKKRYGMTLLLFSLLGIQSHAVTDSVSSDSHSIAGAHQQRTIKLRGTIIDETGETVPGATILVVGTTRGVTTDLDGTFNIDVPLGAKLEISYLGMQSQTITVTQKTDIRIILKQKVDELDEVTVVAFAKQKKESVLASVSTVKPSELHVPSSNLTTALAGRVAGLISYQRSGEPGADNADFFVRGVTTFGYAKSPLILVDGVEMTTSDLARLQVDDIASFSIMKDATATALYGARGANGVILVTTKQGSEGPARMSARFETSISSPTKVAEWADPITYMHMENEAALTRDRYAPIKHSPQKIANTIAGLNPNVFPAVDWYDMLFKPTTVNLRGNLNISGGGKVADYYVAGSISKDEGSFKTMPQTGFDNNINLIKYLLRTNVNVRMTNSTVATVRLHATMDDYTGPMSSGNALYSMITQASPVLFPAYYQPDKANETTPYILFGNYEDGGYLNPFAEMMKGYQEKQSSTMLAQFELKQDLGFITKGLNMRGTFNTTRRAVYSINRSYKPYFFTAGGYNPIKDTYVLTCINPTQGTDYLDVSGESKAIITTNYFEATMDYNRTFGDKHAVGGLLVTYMRDEKNSTEAGTIQSSLPRRNTGLSGRFTYAFDSRYFFEANFGYNGSERFAKKERFGFFPSAGIGYIISNEPFWKESWNKVVHKLKLKATYGLVGNDNIDRDDRFFYLSQVNLNNSSYAYTWGNDFANQHKVNGVNVLRYGNEDITWETSRKTNIGIELGLFNDMELQVDVYQDYRYNIFMERASIPSSMGLQSKIKANIGEAVSRGIDVSLDYNKAFSNGLILSGRANLTWASGKYKIYEEPDYTDTPWLSRINRKMGQQWGLVAERLFVDDKEVANSPTQTFGDYSGGDLKYVDINGDGKISSLDRVPIGYPTDPEIVYGFGLSALWKGFDLSCFFQGLARESFWIDYKSIHPFTDPNADDGFKGSNQVMKIIADNHWTENNQNIYAFWPRLSTTVLDNNSQRNTWFMRDGSFLRLKSLEFGYTLPKKFLKKFQLNTLRIYYSGTNLLCFSKFKLWDPEMAGNGFNYPIQRVHNIGINFAF